VGDGFPHEPGGFCHSVAILGFALNQVNETTEQDVELSRRKICAFAMSFQERGSRLEIVMHLVS